MNKDVFLSNRSEVRFIDRLRECLENCTEFKMTVSFIKSAGMSLISKNIENALKRGVKGRIITSTYKNFTDIDSLQLFYRWMQLYPNFECKLDNNCIAEGGYHSKGYLFEIDNKWEFLVGSTNITFTALTKNIEWNVSLSLDNDSKTLQDALKEFNYLWDITFTLTPEGIDEYKKTLEFAIETWDMDVNTSNPKQFKPNSMQRNALKELERYRKAGVRKALVVASTGSGKTYLAAFDAHAFKAQRLLFIVHRDTILEEARRTFEKVFGKSRTYGSFTGNEKSFNADFIFASNIAMSENLDKFDKDAFDYIVMDECHHVTASTYQKILNYFTPEFLLGLTATPERMDNQDVFEMFDKNVPYELRLRDAINNDLVVPFHYFGIRDEDIDYSDKAKRDAVIKSYSDSHISFLQDEIEKHRPPHTKLKAIAFCIDCEHAKVMADKFADFGYGTRLLTGKNNTAERFSAYTELQDENNPLEIICTVDILNEGIDIPGINMVIFLRPTQSQTIFIQQLGRGLRKFDGKDYLTVLDFIGNSYERSVQVALALGSLTPNTYLEKPLLDSLVRSNFKTMDIPGVEIHFDQKSQDEILKYIEHTNFNTAKMLKQDYENFKIFLGTDKCPTHMDFLNADCAPDLMRLIKAGFNNKKNKSYYTFLKNVGDESNYVFDEDQARVIDQISEFLPIVRKEEYLIIQHILKGINDYSILHDSFDYGGKITEYTFKTAFESLIKYGIIKQNDNSIELNCKVDDDFREYMDDLLMYAFTRYEREFGDFDGEFKLHANYQTSQVMVQLSGVSYDYPKGTWHSKDGKITTVFVGLKKDQAGKNNFVYKDCFLSSRVLQWESQNDTTFDNAEGKKLQSTELVHVFVRKIKKEDGIFLPFTYFGTGHFTDAKESVHEGHPTLMYKIVLDNEVPDELKFDFMVPEPDEEIEA